MQPRENWCQRWCEIGSKEAKGGSSGGNANLCHFDNHVRHAQGIIFFEENSGGFNVFKLLSSGTCPQNVSLFYARPGNVVFLLSISLFLSFVVDLPTTKYWGCKQVIYDSLWITDLVISIKIFALLVLYKKVLFVLILIQSFLSQHSVGRNNILDFLCEFLCCFVSRKENLKSIGRQVVCVSFVVCH